MSELKVIIVNISNGIKISVDAYDDDSVQILKTRIERIFKIEPRFQLLTLNGIVLSDENKTLNEYEIAPESEITLIRIANEGASSPARPRRMRLSSFVLPICVIIAAILFAWYGGLFGNQMNKAATLSNSADILTNQKNYQEAIKLYTEAIEIYRRQQPVDELKMADVIFKIGSVFYLQENYDQSIKSFHQSLDLYQMNNIGNDKSLTQKMLTTLLRIGEILKIKKNYADALNIYNNALDLARNQSPKNQNSIEEILAIIEDIQNELDKLKPSQDQEVSIENDQDEKETTSLDSNEEIAFSLSNIALTYFHQEKYDKMLSTLNQLLEIFKQKKPIDELQIADTLHNIAVALKNLNENQQALKKLYESLKIYKSLISVKTGEEKVTIAKKMALTLKVIGLVYTNEEKYEQAMEMFEDSIELYTDNDAKFSSEIINVYQDIDKLFLKMKKVDESLKIRFKILAVQRNLKPIKELDIADSLNNIGLNFYFMEEYDKSLQFFYESIELYKLYQREHKKTLTEPTAKGLYLSMAKTYENIGDSLVKKEKKKESINYYVKSLELLKSYNPEQEKLIIRVSESIGDILFDESRYDEALQIRQEILDYYRHQNPLDELKIADIINNIGLVFGELEDQDEAISHYNEALNLYKAYLSANEQSITSLLEKSIFVSMAQSLKNIGNSLRKLEKYDQALEFYSQSLELYRTKNPEKKLGIADTLNQIDTIMMHQNNYEKALELRKEILEILKSEKDYDFIDTVSWVRHIAFVYYKQENYAESLKYYQEALSLYEEYLAENMKLSSSYLRRVLSEKETVFELIEEIENKQQELKSLKSDIPIHEQTDADALDNIEKFYLKQFNFRKVLEVRKQQLKIYRKENPIDNKKIAKTLNGIGLILHLEEDYQEAVEHFNESIEYFRLYKNENGEIWSEQSEKEWALEMAKVLENLGDSFVKQKKLTLALKFFNESVMLIRKENPEEDDLLLRILKSIDAILYEQDKYEELLKLRKEIVQIYLKQEAVDEIKVANSINNVGVVLLLKENFDDALQYLYQSLEMYESYNVKKEESFLDEAVDQNIIANMARTLFNIGLAYKSLGSFHESIRFYDKGLELIKTKNQDNEELMAGFMDKIGSVLIELERYDEAFIYSKKALEIYQKLNLNTKTADLLDQMGAILRKQGKYDEALEYFNESLRLRSSPKKN